MQGKYNGSRRRAKYRSGDSTKWRDFAEISRKIFVWRNLTFFVISQIYGRITEKGCEISWFAFNHEKCSEICEVKKKYFDESLIKKGMGNERRGETLLSAVVNRF